MTFKERILKWYVRNEKVIDDVVATTAAGLVTIGALAVINYSIFSRRDISTSVSENHAKVMHNKPTTEDILSKERQKSIDCLLEAETPYDGNPEPVIKSKDGSVMVYRVAEGKYDVSGPGGMVWFTKYSYYRADLKNNTQRKVAATEESGTFSYSNCYLSPNGNFLVLPRRYRKDFTLEPEIRMYDHSARELIWINTTRAESDVSVNSVSDKGVLTVTKGLADVTTIDYRNMPSFLTSSGNEWIQRPVGYRVVLDNEYD